MQITVLISPLLPDEIDQTRRASIDRILSHLYNRWEDLHDGRAHCSFECDSIRLGALTIQMKSGRLFPRPAHPFRGFSVRDILKSVRDFRSPTWQKERHEGPHPCGILPDIDTVMQAIEKEMCGLSPASFL